MLSFIRKTIIMSFALIGLLRLSSSLNHTNRPVILKKPVKTQSHSFSRCEIGLTDAERKEYCESR